MRLGRRELYIVDDEGLREDEKGPETTPQEWTGQEEDDHGTLDYAVGRGSRRKASRSFKHRCRANGRPVGRNSRRPSAGKTEGQ